MQTYIFSCTISKLLQIIDQFSLLTGVALFNALILCELPKCTNMIFGVRD